MPELVSNLDSQTLLEMFGLSKIKDKSFLFMWYDGNPVNHKDPYVIPSNGPITYSRVGNVETVCISKMEETSFDILSDVQIAFEIANEIRLNKIVEV